MLLFNNLFLSEQDVQIPITNRAFQYNDGFFETVMVVGGELRFWRDHQERMQEAAVALKLELPEAFVSGELEEQLIRLAHRENVFDYGRLKLKVWRSGAGLYTPQTNDVDWLATIRQASAPPEAPIHVGVCQSIRTHHSPLSHFKGPNAPIYVLAGIEKGNQDDLLLLSSHGHVSELISSNIFWFRKGTVFTPPLETGCVNGIARRNIMRFCKEKGIASQEVLESLDDVQASDAFFAANVTGIRLIGNLCDTSFQNQHPVVDDLRNTFFQQ